MDNDTAGLVLPPPVYPALAWMAAIALEFFVPLQLFPPFAPTAWHVWLGLALALVGLVIVIRAIRTFRALGTPVEPGRPTLRVVTEGPYRVSRNPIYVGCLAYHAGAALLIGQAWALILSPLVLAAFHILAVLPEERYLARKFGAAYLDYQARTRRWL